MKNPTNLFLVAVPFGLFILAACAEPGSTDSAANVTMGVFSPSHASAQQFSTADALADCDPSNRACSDGARGLHQGTNVRGLLATTDTGHITKGHLGADVFADHEMAVNDDAENPNVL
ncbi:MAG: hypothetical protein AAF997_16580 [Myxococcota bacterium]